MRALVLISLLLLTSACTTVGVTDQATRDALDYGPPLTLRLCVLQDQGVTRPEVDALVDAMRLEMQPFAIDIQVPWVKPFTRTGFQYTEIIQEVVQAHPLTAPCDRIFAFVGRTAGDAAWGLFLPEVLGAVETYTHTRGYAAGAVGSLNQVFSPPDSTAVHEFYHLLGCQHDLVMGACYKQIARLKTAVRAQRQTGLDFTTAPRWDGQWLSGREEADAILNRARWE